MLTNSPSNFATGCCKQRMLWEEDQMQGHAADISCRKWYISSTYEGHLSLLSIRSTDRGQDKPGKNVKDVKREDVLDLMTSSNMDASRPGEDRIQVKEM